MADETKPRSTEDVRWDIWYTEQAHEQAKEAARLASGLGEKLEQLYGELMDRLEAEESEDDR